MGNPLDGGGNEGPRAGDREETWRRLLARKSVVETTEAFLRRMSAAGNPGTHRLKLGILRSERIWHVGWIPEGRAGFLLTPDGRVFSSKSDQHNDWVPYGDAQFFGLDGAAAQAVEEEGRPTSSMTSKDFEYMPEAAAIAVSMAVLIRDHVRVPVPRRI